MTLKQVAQNVAECERCPRLRDHCREVARTKRAQYRDHTYWGRPVPGFGDARARLLMVGLAPGAHGANRTGRMFTGDRSGDFLYAALHRAGMANQPESVDRGDGLSLNDLYIAAAGRCAPPGNKPLLEELERCRDYLRQELRLLRRVKAVLCLGKIAHDAFLRMLKEDGHRLRLSQFTFGHGAAHRLPGGLRMFDSYHPSQQNTFTGRLTPRDLDRVLRSARRYIEAT